MPSPYPAGLREVPGSLFTCQTAPRRERFCRAAGATAPGGAQREKARRRVSRSHALGGRQARFSTDADTEVGAEQPGMFCHCVCLKPVAVLIRAGVGVDSLRHEGTQARRHEGKNQREAVRSHTVRSGWRALAVSERTGETPVPHMTPTRRRCHSCTHDTDETSVPQLQKVQRVTAGLDSCTGPFRAAGSRAIGRRAGNARVLRMAGQRVG